MTIVIKTQSGNLVFNPKNIYVDGLPLSRTVPSFEIKTIGGPGENDVLGIYKSRERTQEVADEILDQLNEIGTLAGCAGLPVYCYEMPKE
jgi:hypothetical protein